MTRMVADAVLGKIARQQNDLFRRVREGTLDPDEVSRRLQDLIEGQLKTTGHLDCLFVAPADQLLLVAEWNEKFSLGFSSEEIASLGSRTPKDHGSGLCRPVIEIRLKAPGETLERLWQITKDRQETAGFGNWRWDGLKSDPEHLRPYQGIEWRRGLRWVTIDLGVNRRRSSSAVRAEVQANELAHAAVLSAAAFFPKWVQSMGQEVDGVFIPFTDMPGFEVSVPGSQPWAHVPRLYWDAAHRQVRLNAGRADGTRDYWCVPCLREC